MRFRPISRLNYLILIKWCKSLFSCEIDSLPITSVFNTMVSPLLPQCSVTCGVGRLTRQVVCSNYHQPVGESFCDPDEKPATEQECNVAPCSYHRQRINDQPYGYPQDPGRHPGHSSWNVPSADNQWRTGPWGAVCSDCDLVQRCFFFL